MASKIRNKPIVVSQDDKPKKPAKVVITSSRKAKRVIQSNGLKFFKEWSERSFTGGSRRKAARQSLQELNPSLYKKLLSKYDK